MTNASTPTLKVEFELSETDLAFFRDRLETARADQADLDESRITAGVADMITKALAANPPEFVKTRLRQLGPLVAMLDDADWNLEGDDRERVLNALAYFADPEDLIPDATPGMGYIDDAIMIELVAAGLAPELEAYSDFVAHREDLAKKDAAPKPPLEEVRTVMQDRMRRRRGRAKAGGLWSHSTVIRHYF